jgi:single-strand DNA-binding protein
MTDTESLQDFIPTPSHQAKRADMLYTDWRKIKMLNSAILMGRLTRDVELRQTDAGTSVCRFSIAVDNGYGENKKTDFINCVAFKGTAEFVAKYFSKGQMIALSGRISTRSWDDNGTTRYATEVIAREVEFCGSKAESQTESNTQDASPLPSPDGFFAVDDDSLPF